MIRIFALRHRFPPAISSSSAWGCFVAPLGCAATRGELDDGAIGRRRRRPSAATTSAASAFTRLLAAVRSRRYHFQQWRSRRACPGVTVSRSTTDGTARVSSRKRGDAASPRWHKTQGRRRKLSFRLCPSGLCCIWHARGHRRYRRSVAPPGLGLLFPKPELVGDLHIIQFFGRSNRRVHTSSISSSQKTLQDGIVPPN